MPDTVDTLVLASGQRNHVVRLTGTSDGTGESAVVKVDKSTLTNFNGVEPAKLVVERIKWSVQGFKYVLLAWDHTTDDEIAVLAGTGEADYRDAGGLVDPGSAGGTGDIVLTSNTPVAGASYDITLYCRLKG